MSEWWMEPGFTPGGAYRGPAPPWRAAEPPPDGLTVDGFFEWLNENYDTKLDRREQYPENSPLWVLWGIEIEWKETRAGEYLGRLLEDWSPIDGISLSLTVVFTFSDPDADPDAPNPRFVAAGSTLQGAHS